MTETILYRAQSLPVIQNRTYATAEEALTSPIGDLDLVAGDATGLVHNRAFDDGKIDEIREQSGNRFNNRLVA